VFNHLDNEIDLSLKKGRLYIKESIKAGNNDNLAYAYDVYGLAHYYQNRLDSALYYADKAIDLFTKIGNKEGLSTAIFNKSNIAEYLGRHNSAINLLYKSRKIDIARGAKRENNIFYYNRLSSILYLQDRYDEAMVYDHQSLSAYLTNGGEHYYMETRIFLNLAWLYAEMDIFELAKYYAKKSYVSSYKANQYSHLSSCLQVFAYCASKQGDYNEAVSYARAALKKALKYKESFEILYSKAALAGYLKDIEGAKQEESQFWKEIDSTLQGQKNYEKDLSILKDISEYYKRENDFPKAMAYLEEYMEIKKDISTLDVREIQAEFKKELAESEKALMLGNLQLREKESLLKNIIIIGISIILTVLSIILLIYVKSRKKILLLNRSLNVSHRDLSQKEEELRESFKELKENYKEINELNESKNRLFSILSHDLKQPFNQIIAVLDLIDQDVLDNYDRKEIVSDLKESVEETSSMVNNLLQWSKSQFEGIESQLELININNLVKRVSLELSVLLKKKSIYLDLLVDENMHLTADKEQLSSIIRNILSNAFKFSEYNSMIVISSGVSEDGHFGLLHISDNGIGMTETQIANLLSKDKKTSLPGTNNELGTGIGMMIVQDFLKQNDGYLEINSELGNGSTFTIGLPCNKKKDLKIYQ
jgi:signal transduction histidine kinase